MPMRKIVGVLAGAALVATLGCSVDSTQAGSGLTRLSVALTDAPPPGDALASASIDIGRVELMNADGEFVTLTDDAGTFDLLKLQDGVTATLATLDVPAGSYKQIRLFVTGAEVTLRDGLTFRDGSTTKTLKVPSGTESGIKVNLFGTDWTMPGMGQGDQGAGQTTGSQDLERRMGVEFTPGETILVLDFDVGRNFVLTGPRDAPTGALFKPLIRAVVRDVAGSIAGVVTDATTGQPVAGATVRATLQDSPVLPELQTAEATAVTADDGTYTIWFLAPGTYSVSVDGFSAAAQTVVVALQQAVIDVNFAVTP
jgi:hypothetical protein